MTDCTTALLVLFVLLGLFAPGILIFMARVTSKFTEYSKAVQDVMTDLRKDQNNKD